MVTLKDNRIYNLQNVMQVKKKDKQSFPASPGLLSPFYWNMIFIEGFFDATK